MSKPTIIVSVDVECDGHYPPKYSMLSIGASVVGAADCQFYSEICPISENFIPEALAISGLDRNRLLQEAPKAKEVMTKFVAWINELKNKGPVLLLCAPTSFDASFLNYYFHEFIGTNPFGLGNYIDMRSYWFGKAKCNFDATGKRELKKIFGLEALNHSHNALEDAIEQAIYFEHMLKYDNILIDFVMELLHKIDRKIVVYRKENKMQSAVTMLHEFKTKSETSQEFLKEIKDHLLELIPLDIRKHFWKLKLKQ